MNESPLTDHGVAPTRGVGLVAHVEPYDGAPDECTIYPVGLDDVELVTSWISAREGSYVDVSTMR